VNSPIATPRNGWPIRSRIRALLVAAVLLVLLLVAVWPTGQGSHPVAPVIPAFGVAPPSPVTDSVTGPVAVQIVAGNLFSATRRAPTARFVPPGTEATGTPPNAPGMTDDPTGQVDIASVTDGPRLFGIVAQDGRRRALLQLPGTDSVLKLLDIGDRRGGYRVVSISADRVVLASSTGSRTLRLVARTSPDSLENLP